VSIFFAVSHVQFAYVPLRVIAILDGAGRLASLARDAIADSVSDTHCCTVTTKF
jgi:hypothetical protein